MPKAEEGKGAPLAAAPLTPLRTADGQVLLRFAMQTGSLRANLSRMLKPYSWKAVWDQVPECLDWTVASAYVVQGKTLQELVASALNGYPLRSVLHIPNRTVAVAATQYLSDGCDDL